MSRIGLGLARLHRWDEALCLRLNRAIHLGWLRALLKAASRLGDGVFWYALMAALLAYHGESALAPVLRMVLAGVACTALYKWLKAKTLRPRPYRVMQSISLGAAPLDQFSFPSGHTLHAVAFSLIATFHFPDTAWLVWPFTGLVALSRPVLGLHYPSDVLAGAAIGSAVAAVSLLV